MRYARRRNLYQLLRFAILTLAIWTLIESTSINSALRQRPPTSDARQGPERVYIASIHWNNEAILKSHWVPAVLDLVKEFGSEQVYVSVQESGSWDDSKGALRILQDEMEKLGIRHTIILDDTTHLDEISKPVKDEEEGWIRTPRDKLELRRIPYLSRLRNLVMEPLYQLQASGKIFDKILFLNDVVFTTQDVRNLIATRNGDYAAACSLDFSKPPQFYDTFAIRDAQGFDAIMQTWPYFRASESRHALLANTEVPVSSCWNGMVAMDATPFYTHNLTFRGIPDSLALHHLEGSECCLIHADNPLSHSKGVWLNPNVRVGYNEAAYQAANAEDGLSTYAIARGIWENRIYRWFSATWFKNRIVRSRLASWQSEDVSNRESGTFCLINEMQVLVHNGWAHL